MSEMQQTGHGLGHAAEIGDDGTLRAWLEDQARRHGLTTLLAHADDGVIWGRFDASGTLTTADSAFPELARLRLFTLQQCRAFGPQAEVLLWRDDRGCRARLVSEQENASATIALWQSGTGWQAHMNGFGAGETIDEDQILWGTQGEGERDGFTLLADGRQGLRHAVPLTGIPFDTRDADGDTSDGKRHRPIRLSVRHYIDYNDGVARIALSRLVALTSVKQ